LGLTQAQRTLLERARSVGAGNMGVALSDGACAFIVSAIARDLQVEEHFEDILGDPVDFFDLPPGEAEVETQMSVTDLFERLVDHARDGDTYFACLASLQKSRLKYARILECQPLPTMDQVGPRALLQYGTMSPQLLAGFLLWRKWIFDIDNRAGQETGYLFEPIIAHAIGGVPASARHSPVWRRKDGGKGRQVDCIRERHAYEIKIRVTIAASGQGRWREELDFPEDCKASGYKPVLVVLDPTPNPKLDELVRTFLDADGEVYIGEDAWGHLENVAGPTMARFLEKYVRRPIEDVLQHTPTELPPMTFSIDDTCFMVSAGGDSFESPRESLVEDEDPQENLDL
jgi:hypothetical protein